MRMILAISFLITAAASAFSSSLNMEPQVYCTLDIVQTTELLVTQENQSSVKEVHLLASNLEEPTKNENIHAQFLVVSSTHGFQVETILISTDRLVITPLQRSIQKKIPESSPEDLLS